VHEGRARKQRVCRDPETRPTAVQCLQHPYFQVGVRAPLSSRSPASAASSTTVKSAQPFGLEASVHLRLSQHRRLSREPSLPLGIKPTNSGVPVVGRQFPVMSRAPAASLQRDSFAAARDSTLLPSLSSIGPRNARYKPGVHPGAAAEGGCNAPRDGSAKQAISGLLPQVNTAPIGRGVAVGKLAGGLEPRYSLGRRY
jgi:hypothetical protein